MLTKAQQVTRLLREYGIVEISLSLEDALQLAELISKCVLLEANQGDVVSIQVMLSESEFPSTMSPGSNVRRGLGILGCEACHRVSAVGDEILQKEVDRAHEFINKYNMIE